VYAHTTSVVFLSFF